MPLNDHKMKKHKSADDPSLLTRANIQLKALARTATAFTVEFMKHPSRAGCPAVD